MRTLALCTIGVLLTATVCQAQQGAGETIKQSAVRELEEESGVKTEKIEEVAVIDFFDDQEQVFECHVFFAKEWEGEPKETKEMGPPKLYKLNDMPYEEMWKADRTWLSKKSI